MSRNGRRNPDELLNAFLDGELDASQRAAFLADTQTDDALRRRMALQADIDAALRRRIIPPDVDAALERIRTAERAGVRPGPGPRGDRRFVLLVAAAAAVLVASTSAILWWSSAPSQELASTRQSRPANPRRTLEEVYRDALASGFKCDWECKNEKEFAWTYYYSMHQGLLLAAPPDYIKVNGLAYSNSITHNTVHLLAYVRGEPVIVFGDEAAEDKGQKLCDGSPLQLFKRQVGEIVLYELTPLDKPHLLDLFYDPQKPADWYVDMQRDANAPVKSP